MKDITFVGNARCYHSMDWFRTVRSLSPTDRSINFLTDLIDSERHAVLVRSDDNVGNLYNIDWLLFRQQSRLSDAWRNVVKLLLSPVQVILLRRYVNKHPGRLYHAHTMYYMFVCAMAGVPFIGTPQGSEVLVRPLRSALYRRGAIKALQAAKVVTVDSVKMRDEIRKLAGVDAMVIQNGVDVDRLKGEQRTSRRTEVVSLRGFTDLYQIDKILDARARSLSRPPLTFIYPFWDDAFKARCAAAVTSEDRDLGRLDKDAMYALLGATALAISVPKSDSSPRSVYEAIFAGACVAATHGTWYDALPACMKARIFIVDLAHEGWLDRAIEFSEEVGRVAFEPSAEAIEQFDQVRSMRRAIDLLYA
jgi:hypothetical protein